MDSVCFRGHFAIKTVVGFLRKKYILEFAFASICTARPVPMQSDE